ncbi:RNA-protein complex protein Nop10 [Candidatus Micrarchaeota archaeon]|nr:RNA-protein complex protein Nop10 [Candidatus Micrarchaeota archaeon]
MNVLHCCSACATYTLKKACPSCGKKTRSAHPAKYSKEDPFRSYRRNALYRA